MKRPFLISFAIVLLGGAASIYTYYNLTRNERNSLVGRLDAEANNMGEILEWDLHSRIASLERMAQRWEAQKGTDSLHWFADAANYYEDQPGYQAIEWIDSGLNVRWVEPMLGNEKAVGLDLAFEEKRRRALQSAREKFEPTLSEPINLVQGGKGFLAYIPVHFDNRFQGFITGVFSLEPWISKVIPLRIKEQFAIRVIHDADTLNTITHKAVDYDLSYKGISLRSVGGFNYYISVIPTVSYVKDHLSIIPDLVLVFGLSLSILLGYIIYNTILISRARREEAISNRKLEVTYQRLAFKNKEMEQLTYIASHDLMEPVRTLTSFTDLLTRYYTDQLDQRGKDYLNFINQSADRMQALIHGLLDHSRIGRSQEMTDVDCNEIIQEVLTDLSTMIREQNASINVLEMPVIVGNKVEIRLLFQNLIGNAIKYRQKNIDPIVTIKADRMFGFWRFSIQDNGIGIDKSQYEKVFRFFQRLHDHNEYQGSGIGLAHCKKIVDIHGGKIWVESALGEGSTFYFTIPILK